MHGTMNINFYPANVEKMVSS